MENLRFKLYLFASLLLLSLLLDYVYINHISVIFNYAGFDYNPNYNKAWESKFFILIIALLIPNKITKPSDIILLWFIVFPVTPVLSLYWLRDEPRIFTYFVILCTILLSISKNYKGFRITKVKSNKYFVFYISIAFSLIGIAWFIISGAINNFNLNLLRVYDFRRDVSEVLAYGPMGYISVWTYKVFSIYLLAFSFHYKRKLLIIVFICLQIFYFGVTSHKSVLFYPFLILGFYIIFKKSNSSYKLFSYLTIFLVLLYFTFIFTNNQIFVSLGFRRSFFVTASNHYAYFNIFSDLGFTYMSNGILSFLFQYPYDRDPFFLVGEILGEPDMRANVGYLATSYMHFGFAGMIVFTIIVSALLKLVDSISSKNNIPNWFASSMVIIPFNSVFTSSEITTTLLTHGLAISILLLWLSNFKSIEERCKTN